MRRVFFIALGCALLMGCGSQVTTVPTSEGTVSVSEGFLLSNPTFSQGEAMPVLYTCDGDNISPALMWTDPPEGTQSLALIADDPDAPAGTWIHWVVYNIPAEARDLSAAYAAESEHADGSRSGKNSWNQLGYGGPCPPSGTHHYFFKLYALDILLDLEPGATHRQLLDVMEEHILAQTELMVTYSR